MSTVIPSELHLGLQREFKKIVVFSGAGMSAESGIPTFRSGADGLWHNFRPEQLATLKAWRANKSLVWGWYVWRWNTMANAVPHGGYESLKRLQSRLCTTVITQNVDDLHERAGVKDVLHLHGRLAATRCDICGIPQELPLPAISDSGEVDPTPCLNCSGHIRPGVVWFNEELDRMTVANAQREINACDLLLIVGTSGLVYPAAGLVNHAPPNALVVEINPEHTGFSRNEHVDFHLATSASVGLTAIADLLLAMTSTANSQLP